MSREEIVQELGETKQVEKIVWKLLKESKNPVDAPEDLIQEIYLVLLTKDPKYIESLWAKGELGYYIIALVRNNLFSVNSRYYYKYIKMRSLSDDIRKAEDIIYED